MMKNSPMTITMGEEDYEAEEGHDDHEEGKERRNNWGGERKEEVDGGGKISIQ